MIRYLAQALPGGTDANDIATGLLTVGTAVGVISLIHKLQDVLRYLRAQDWNGVVGTVGAWAIGLLAAVVVAKAPELDQIRPITGAGPMRDYSFAGLLVVGCAWGALANLRADGLAARDDQQTSRKPRLLGPPTPRPPEA